VSPGRLSKLRNAIWASCSPSGWRTFASPTATEDLVQEALLRATTKFDENKGHPG